MAGPKDKKRDSPRAAIHHSQRSLTGQQGFVLGPGASDGEKVKGCGLFAAPSGVSFLLVILIGLKRGLIDWARLELSVTRRSSSEAAEGRTPRPVGDTRGSRKARSVLECGCPLPLLY